MWISYLVVKNLEESDQFILGYYHKVCGNNQSKQRNFQNSQPGKEVRNKTDEFDHDIGA